MSVILTIIPYHFYPPQNGGSLRCFYILREMAKEHKVFLFTVQPATDFSGIAEPKFPENVTIISICNAKPYHSVFNILPSKLADAINYRMLKRSLTVTSNSYFLQAYPLLSQTLAEIKPAIVYYENLEAVSLFAAHIKKYLPVAKQLYDAHNIDSELWMQLSIAQNNQSLKAYSNNALLSERNLHKKLDGVICCSSNDQDKLLKLNENLLDTWIIPNGVDCSAKAFDNNPNKILKAEILFCGSLNYYPNEEGLLWFYQHVYPLVKSALPDIVLTLVGSMDKGKFSFLSTDSSVRLEGIVENVQPFYYRAAVCIAPLLSGSGTRLKILEAMSFGNPVIATAIGAEGIDVVPGKHILLANEPQDFADNIIRILQSNILFDQIRNAAHDLVKTKYDWGKIGIEINKIIEQILEVQITEEDC